jgi:hypothetical protein
LLNVQKKNNFIFTICLSLNFAKHKTQVIPNKHRRETRTGLYVTVYISHSQIRSDIY